jgi:hypothetical protein
VTLAAVLTLAACGSSKSASAKIGPQGGILATRSGLQLAVPAGALSQEVEIQLHDAAPHDGAVARIEMEPKGLKLGGKARVSVKLSDDSPMKLVEIEDGTEAEHALENEQENQVEHSREAQMDHLGTVELRHQHSCDVACDAGMECDDGVCQVHQEHPLTCDPVCAAGSHCDDGLCQVDDDAAPPPPGTTGCDPACAAGFECDATDLVCKPHGGGK